MRGPLGAVIGRYPSSDGTQIDGIIRHNRKCRDVAFLVVFIAFWVAMIVNSSFGFNKGNPLRYNFYSLTSFGIVLRISPFLSDFGSFLSISFEDLLFCFC